MGAIPIVENSTLYPIYREATILVVENFRNITVNILNQPQKHIGDMSFSRKILYFDTWWQRVEQFRPIEKYLDFSLVESVGPVLKKMFNYLLNLF